MSLKQMINGQLVNIAGGSPATASSVAYDNTTSGLEAENTQEAIDEINTALSDLTESVSITADGVKTRSQLLNELYAAADMTKLTNRAVIVRGVFIYHLVRDTNFTCCNWTDTSPFVQVQYIKLLASGSVQGFVTPSANTDQSSSSETSGVEYTLYY